MPKDSACLWNIGLFYQKTCWGCHMACTRHSVQDNRTWVHAWSALWAGLTEVEHICSHSTYLSDAATMEPELSVSSTLPFSGFQRTWTIPRQEGTEDGLLLVFLGGNKWIKKGLMIQGWWSWCRIQMSQESGDLCLSSLPTPTRIHSIRKGSCLHVLSSANHLTRAS